MTPTEAADRVLAYGLSLPGTHEDHPWGDTVLKVDGKIFVFLGQPSAERFGFAVKLPRSGGVLLESGRGTPTGYGLGRHGWVSVTVKEGEVDAPTLLGWIDESYRAVAKKRRLKELDAR